MGRKKLPAGSTKAEQAARKREAKQAPRQSEEELQVYASGNGSLSFTWLRYDHDKGARIATGRTVTMEDARNHMSSSPDVAHLVEKGWKLWDNYGRPLLVADVERTGPNTIRMGDREYEYSINQTDPFYIRDGEVRQCSLKLSVVKNEPDWFREVKNVNSLAAAAYFLTHEKQLDQNPPETLLYQLA